MSQTASTVHPTLYDGETFEHRGYRFRVSDRVPCPGLKRKADCVCDRPNNGHETVPRIAVQDMRLERRLRAELSEYNDRLYKGRDWRQEGLPGWAITTQGDPRGYVLRVIPPSYAERNANRPPHDLDAIGVPSRPSGLRW